MPDSSKPAAAMASLTRWPATEGNEEEDELRYVPPPLVIILVVVPAIAAAVVKPGGQAAGGVPLGQLSPTAPAAPLP